MRTLSSFFSVKNSIDFNFANNIEITSSYNLLTERASVVVPKKIKYTDSEGNDLAVGPEAIFKRGDDCSISLGYDQNTQTVFTGYLSGIKNKYPLEFSCEDDMYKLKQNNYTFSLKNPSLSELLEVIIPEDVSYELTSEFNLGDIRVTNASTAEVLDSIRKKNGVYSFFRDTNLYVGLAVVPELQNTVRFTFFRDIINGDGLTWVNEDERKIKVKAISIKPDNTRLEAEAGDSSGEVRTLYFYNIDNVADLQAIADAQVNELRYSGFVGDFTTFMTPRVNHGDIIELVNPQIPEKNGAYLVDKVVTTCGMNGGRQKISIKQKVGDVSE